MCSAHKAANPEKHPVKSESKLLYPPLEGIEERYGPTKVHLQVYDGAFLSGFPSSSFLSNLYRVDCAHTLPILFAFTTPGKFCFRAMSTFIKYATGLLPKPGADKPMILENDNKELYMTASPASTQANLLATNGVPPRMTMSRSEPLMKSRRSMPALSASPEQSLDSPAVAVSPSSTSDVPPVPPVPASENKGKTRRALSARVSRASSFLRRRPAPSESEVPPVPGTPLPRPRGHESSGSDVAGPRWQFHKSSADPLHRHAGEQEVYDNGLVRFYPSSELRDRAANIS